MKNTRIKLTPGAGSRLQAHRFRPHLEAIEARIQPGSLLTNLLDLSLESAFRLQDAPLTPSGRVASNQPLLLLTAEQTADTVSLTPATREVVVSSTNLSGQPVRSAAAPNLLPLPATWSQTASTERLAQGVGSETEASRGVLLLAAGSQTGRVSGRHESSPPVILRTNSAAAQLLRDVQMAASPVQQTAQEAQMTPVTVRSLDIPVRTDRFDTTSGPNTTLVYSTFFGGDAEDAGWDITADNAGNSYATGSIGFGEDRDLFVSKVDNQGQLEWVSYFGTSGADEGRSISLDSAGNLYVTGYYTNEAGDQDIIFGQFLSDGSVNYVLAFEFAGNDTGTGIHVVGNNYYVAGTVGGETESSTLVARFQLDGTLDYGGVVTFAGGPSEANAVTADTDGNAYFVGSYYQDGFEKQVLYFSLDAAAQFRYGFSLTHAGDDAGLGVYLVNTPAAQMLYITGSWAGEEFETEGAIIRVRADDGTQPTLTRILSSAGSVVSNDIVVDAAGNPVITGSLTIDDNMEAIVVKVLGGAGLDYFLMLGSGNETGRGMVLGNNAVGVVGTTSSKDFPVTENALQPIYGGGVSDAWGGLFSLD